MKLFKLKTIARRLLTKKLKFHRPTAYPFITGDGFRALALHVYDENTDFSPEKVESRDIVFVNGDFLKVFFETKHPHIQHKYILISHNSDINLDPKYAEYIDEKIIHWFAKNLCFSHKKVTPIPIGLTNMFCNRIGTLSELRASIEESKTIPKDAMMSYGFSLVSNVQRMRIATEIAPNHPAIKEVEYEIDSGKQQKYFRNISAYKAIISPEGNGADCHRTWEAFYLGIVPVVKQSCFTEYFKNLGLPMIIVDDWNELNSFDKNYIEEKYSQLNKSFSHPAIYMNYWMDLILSKQQ